MNHRQSEFLPCSIRIGPVEPRFDENSLFRRDCFHSQTHRCCRSKVLLIQIRQHVFSFYRRVKFALAQRNWRIAQLRGFPTFHFSICEAVLLALFNTQRIGCSNAPLLIQRCATSYPRRITRFSSGFANSWIG